MSDYKRVVSYIYQYNQKVKGENVGFVRIETRKNQCKITIHIRVQHMQLLNLKAYLYCWIEGKLHAINIGNVVVQNGIGDLKIVTLTNNLCDTMYHLNDMAGAIIIVSSKEFLGTEWDNNAIQFDELIIDKKKSVPVNSVQAINHQENNQREIEEKKPIQEKEIIQEASKFVAQESSKEKNSVVKSIVQEEEKINYESLAKEIGKEETLKKESSDEQEQVVENKKENSSETVVNNVTTSEEISKEKIVVKTEENNEETEERNMERYKANIKKVEKRREDLQNCTNSDELLQIEKEIKQLELQIEELNELCSNYHKQEKEKEKIEEEIRTSLQLNVMEPTETNNMVVSECEIESKQQKMIQRIFSRYPKIEPFEDKSVEECIKIEPQDIGIFPMEHWVLANNSFLLHGYYSYRHLIFLKKKKDNKVEYLLGVPGVNQSREKFMANMFGFDYFQCLTLNEPDPGDFGYWCLKIEL